MAVPRILYYYCNVDSFFKIIQSNEFWLSDSYVLSDYRENTWINPIIENKLKNIRNKNNEKLIEKILETYYLNKKINIPFVSCFSTDGDVLSQWRAYAEDGTGVAIGINSGELKIKNLIPYTGVSTDNTLGISEIIYDYDQQMQIVGKSLDYNLNLFEKNKKSFDDIVIDSSMVLQKYSTVFKNPKFQEEKEWRIIHTPLILTDPQSGLSLTGNISDIHFRASKRKLISYFKLKLADYIDGEPFSEILLGPKCEVSRHSIEVFLSGNVHKDIKVRFSEASYR